MAPRRRLYRSRTDRTLAGVAGGIADYLDIDPTIVRVVWVLSIFLGGFGILLYVILAFVMPLEPAAGPTSPPASAPATPGPWPAAAEPSPAQPPAAAPTAVEPTADAPSPATPSPATPSTEAAAPRPDAAVGTADTDTADR